MNSKPLVLLILPLMLFSSCKNDIKLDDSYNEDLQKLSIGPWKSKDDITDYDISCVENRTTTNKYVYTVKISYSAKELFYFKAVVVPEENLSDYEAINLPSVGYTSTMHLVSIRKEGDKNRYSQYKLQIEKVTKQNSIYVSVSYGNNQDLIKF